MAELHLKRQQREISPDRTKVWTEPSKPRCPVRSVPVVYYLTVNGQLQHPHFMELPLSSPQGLHLKDFINRLNVLRGRGMAPMYSWSCKRSYKNGFVWHDLSDNDLIYPAHGHHEYVLKGSELPQIQDAFSDAQASDSARRRRNQSCSSIDFIPQEYSVNKADPTADVSTQTEDIIRRRPPPEIVEENSKGDEIEVSSISAPPSESSPDTLETIMESDRRLVLRRDESIGEEATVNSKPIFQKEGMGAKSSVLMKLISCGSISFKDCGAGHGGLGLISQYKNMRVPRGRMKTEEKEYFSGSLALAETKKQEFPDLKRSASYNADRSIRI